MFKSTTQARNNAIDPDDIKLKNIKKKELVQYISVIESFADGSYTYMGYDFDPISNFFYAIVPLAMFKRGVRLPSIGATVKLLSPFDIVLNGAARATATNMIVSSMLQISKNYRVAKVILTRV